MSNQNQADAELLQALKQGESKLSERSVLLLSVYVMRILACCKLKVTGGASCLLRFLTRAGHS